MSLHHKQTLKDDLIIRAIKILDFGFIIPIYTIGAIFGALFLDKYVYKYIKIINTNNIQDETDFELFTNVVIVLLTNTIVAYILRNLLQKIPFPLDKYRGFEHMRVTEVRSGSVILMILLLFSSELRLNIQELHRRYIKRNINKTT